MAVGVRVMVGVGEGACGVGVAPAVVGVALGVKGFHRGLHHPRGGQRLDGVNHAAHIGGGEIQAPGEAVMHGGNLVNQERQGDHPYHNQRNAPG